MHDVKLTGDITLGNDDHYVITHEVDIDLNGHSITSTRSSAIFQVNGGALTITGAGSITNNAAVATVSNYGSIEIENENCEITSLIGIALITEENGTVIVDNGTITGHDGAIASNGASGMITVNGGHLIGTNGYAIATSEETGYDGNTIVINDGVLEGNANTAEGKEAVGVYIANGDSFTMNDGDIIANGGTGICMRGGNVTINGGSITATDDDGNGNPVDPGAIGSDETVFYGTSGIIYHKVEGFSGYTDGMQLTVTGGSITAYDYSIEVIGDEDPNITVTGGDLNPGYSAPEAEPEG